MFQRIKGAIDQTIAQEQARQRLSQSSPSRSASNSKRSSSRNLSPGKRPGRQARGRQEDGSPLPSTKGPDPSSFEPDFVIGEDDLSRSGTPRPPADVDGAANGKTKEPPTEGGTETLNTVPQTDSPGGPLELPTDVRVKLRKLEKLEARYHELLRSYRIAHARVQTIEPFEASLRENTPLTSISDPYALVEYLNQVNLKGDMVLDELKRVSSDRDGYKRKLSEAEKSTKEAWDEVAVFKRGKAPERTEGEVNGSRAEDEKVGQDSADSDPLGATKKSPPASIKSPTPSLRGLSLFSPKLKSTDSPKLRQGSEDLFSYDGEIPRLESESKEKQERISSLTHEVETLRGDLAVTRESTQSMVQTLEESTREVSTLRDARDRSEAEHKDTLERALRGLRGELRASEEKLQTVRADHTSHEAGRVEDLEKQLKDAKVELDEARKTASQVDERTNKVKELQGLVTTLQSEITESKARNTELTSELESSSKSLRESEETVKELDARPAAVASNAVRPRQDVEQVDAKKAAQTTIQEPAAVTDTTSVSKKKNKKKKKVGKASGETEKEPTPEAKAEAPSTPAQSKDLHSTTTIAKLRQELKQLQALIDEKDAAIAKVNSKLKNQEGLQEEIETLRDDLLHVGQEHVETKDKTKELQAEKIGLEKRVAAQEAELAKLQGTLASDAVSDQKHEELAMQFERLKTKAATLQTDLSAAQQLASSRFKDLNDLRNVLQKAQPEIDKLRSEAVEMKGVKEALGKKEAEFKRLDSRHEDMRSEVTGLKQTIATKESEITSLNKKINQETSGKLKAEEGSSKATLELQRVETERRQANESIDRLSKELAKLREELNTTKAKLRDTEQQLSKHRNDSAGLREEVELKAAQYASAQSLMASMRDQTAEMATQMKEARERCESLDEEVADAHRLLSERSREGETMRRLLADVEGRADARTREMKERMDTAIEERDRAEDEASTAGRRRARELEDLRNKYRDVEKNLKRAEDDKEELELAQRDWKRRREELESRAEGSQGEVEGFRKAMGELRDALDESEKQARELEKQKSELRRSVEETQHRLEKLQKSNKSMADEISKMQAARKVESEVQSSRSSSDSAARVASPAPSNRKPSATPVESPGNQRQASNGQPAGQMDYVYLKNVLLQFLEQKDKKHQQQLIPVLGMLLHFDRKDEQRWMSAVNSKA